MLSLEEIRVMQSILNTDWGRASTENQLYPISTVPQFSIKGHLVGKTKPEGDDEMQLVLKYVTVVSFNDYMEMYAQKEEYTRQAEKLFKETIKDIKAKFKAEAERPLTTKQHDVVSAMEVISTTPHAPVRRAYFRANVVFDVK